MTHLSLSRNLIIVTCSEKTYNTRVSFIEKNTQWKTKFFGAKVSGFVVGFLFRKEIK